jgi:hypothetical protein
MVIYEWKDVGYLGKPSSQIDDTLPVSWIAHMLIRAQRNDQRTYVCTMPALSNGFCNSSSLGQFIFDLPPDKSLSDTTFWNARVGFHPENTTAGQGPARKVEIPGQGSSFWDNPDGNPTPPASEYNTPPRDIPLSYKSSSTLISKLFVAQHNSSQNSTVPGANASYDILWYENPIKYEVHNTGYYCVGMRSRKYFQKGIVLFIL